MKRNVRKNLFDNKIKKNKSRADLESLKSQSKNTLKEKSTLQSKDELFEKIRIGEIIFAKMPLPEKILNNIAESHRQRPYIVVGKLFKKDRQKSKLICYGASHTPPKNAGANAIFTIHKSFNENYHREGKILKTWTDSYYNLENPVFLPIDNMIEIFQVPEISDIQRLQRKLIMLKNAEKKVYHMNLEFSLEEGDIVKLNTEYAYVYSSYKSEVFAHQMKTSVDAHEDAIEIFLNHKRYYIMSSTQIKLSNQDYMHLCHSLDPKEIAEISSQKKSRKSNKKQVEKLKQNLDKLNIWFPIGQVLNFRYGYEQFVYLYHFKKDVFAVSMDEMKKLISDIHNRELSDDEDFNLSHRMIELINLSEIGEYDKAQECIEPQIMKIALKRIFDKTQEDIKEILYLELRSDEEKFRDLLLSQEESCETLLKYYGLSQ